MSQLISPKFPKLLEPQAIDVSWLSQALSNDARHVQVIDFTQAPVGTGQVGETSRLKLKYADGAQFDAPNSLILKHHSSSPDSRAIARALNLYSNECGYYADLAHSTGVSGPIPYFVQYDADADRFILLMEDIAPARMGDQLAGISTDELRLAVLEGAKLHASHWNDQRVGDLPWINTAPLAQGVISPEGTQPFVKQAAVHFADHLLPEYLEVIRQYEEGCFHWNKPLNLPRSITHNDFRPDNFLFGTDPAGKPISIVDWQTMSFHYGPLDIAFLIGGGSEGEARHKSEQQLIPEYHAMLCERGVKDFSLEQCWDTYRYFTFAGLTVALVASMTVKRTERGDRLFANMLSRHASHVLEHDALRYLKS